MEATPASSTRTTKRKLEDAIRSLDDAIISPSLAVERPTPSKRPHLTHSMYSTLEKIGAISKEHSRPPVQPTWHSKSQYITSSESNSPNRPAIDVSKNAPHLSAILARSRSKKTLPFCRMRPVYPASEYRPSSTDSFFSRLATYKVTTYANKPPLIDAVAAARCGWTNDGKDRLICRLCEVSWVLAGREGMNKEAASALVEKQRVSLVEMHKDGCPWKARQCDPSVYRVPLQTPAIMIRELRITALSLEPLLTDITVRHPLNSSQLNSLRFIFSVAAAERWESGCHPASSESESPGLSDSAIVAALFGWVPSQTAICNKDRRASFASISHAGPYGFSASAPPMRSLSCVSSASSPLQEMARIPTASASPRSAHNKVHPDQMRSTSQMKHSHTTVSRDASLLQCILCQRRIGLWGYAARSKEVFSSTQVESSTSAPRQCQKEFDLVKEHRSYCPYVVSSSVVPSYSTVDTRGNTIEGWRAVLTVVQRHELGQQQRLSRFISRGDLDNCMPSAELQGIENMVAGVKTNGGRELLRYVKGLLG